MLHPIKESSLKNSFLLSMIALLYTGLATAQEPAVPGIRTKQPLTILSANDGQVHRRQTPDVEAKKIVTPDSITVIHLGPDHPPIVKTVYGTVPNTIQGAPYMAMTGDGHYGFVTCRSGPHDPKDPDVLSVIDLSDADLKVVQTIKLPNPKMALMHPDGRRLLVPSDSGIHVFEMRAGKLELLKDNPTDVHPGSIAITPKGDRIASQGTKKGSKRAVHIFSYRDGTIEYQSEVKIQAGLPDWDGPFAFRFTPDGRRLIIPNGNGVPSRGKLDPVFIADMTQEPPTVTEVIPQVADGIESVAVHPNGRFAVLSCLDDSPRIANQANSHLAVVDLTAKPARLLYQLPVESVPEGIEFTPDGTQLFVQLTFAHRIAAYDVKGFLLERSPFVIRVGHGPSSMAIGPRFMK
jgi:WD40 repeat protein